MQSDKETTSSHLYNNQRARVCGHEQELKDRTTMTAYLKAIYKNKHLFNGKHVLDLSCGLAVRSMAAVKAGAKHVWAVDDPCIIEQTRLVVEANGMADSITLLSTNDVTTIMLPIKAVDVILSAWMGQALLYKSTILDMIKARDRWLAADGIVFPSKARLLVSAVDVTGMVMDRIYWWQDVYGFDMGSMSKLTTVAPTQISVYPRQVITNSCEVFTLNAMECTAKDLDFTAPFTLRFHEDGTTHGLLVHFEVEFGFCHTYVGFSTSPFCRRTRYEQTLFYLNESLTCSEGSTISGTIRCLMKSRQEKGCTFFISPTSQIKVARPPSPKQAESLQLENKVPGTNTKRPALGPK